MRWDKGIFEADNHRHSEGRRIAYFWRGPYHTIMSTHANGTAAGARY